jgi:hypothetical protein
MTMNINPSFRKKSWRAKISKAKAPSQTEDNSVDVKKNGISTPFVNMEELSKKNNQERDVEQNLTSEVNDKRTREVLPQIDENKSATVDKQDGSDISASVESEDAEMKKKIQNLQRRTEEGFSILQAMALFGGVVIIFSSTFAFQERGIEGLSVDYFIISFYSWIFGLFTIALEGRVFLIDISSVHRAVSNYMKGFRYMTGRGLFYIFVGGFHSCLMTAISTICGGFMATVGLLTLIIGLYSRSQLKKTLKQSKQKSLSQYVFDFYDVDHDGYIDADGFRDLIIGLGIANKHGDTEFQKMDTDDDGLIMYPEAKKWVEDIDHTNEIVLEDINIIGLLYTDISRRWQ